MEGPTIDEYKVESLRFPCLSSKTRYELTLSALGTLYKFFNSHKKIL